MPFRCARGAQIWSKQYLQMPCDKKALNRFNAANIRPPEIHRCIFHNGPDSKVHGANMGPTWVLSAPDGPHVGPMNLAIRGVLETKCLCVLGVACILAWRIIHLLYLLVLVYTMACVYQLSSLSNFFRKGYLIHWRPIRLLWNNSLCIYNYNTVDNWQTLFGLLTYSDTPNYHTVIIHCLVNTSYLC